MLDCIHTIGRNGGKDWFAMTRPDAKGMVWRIDIRSGPQGPSDPPSGIITRDGRETGLDWASFGSTAGGTGGR